MTCLKTSLSTKNLERAFSRAAASYDEFSGFHRHIADELMKKAVAQVEDAHHILDIGCGTGYLSGKAKRFFPYSKITGVDFSEGMLAKAQTRYQGINWTLADAAQLPFEDQSVDLIVSNLSYQWALDLSKAFTEAHRVLTNEKMMMATLFGFKTCDELFTSLLSTEDFRFNRLANAQEIEKSLKQAGFKKIQIESQVIGMPFKDLWHLLSWLKAIGTNRLTPETFLGPQALQKANRYALRNYPEGTGIRVSFEVINIQATK